MSKKKKIKKLGLKIVVWITVLALIGALILPFVMIEMSAREAQIKNQEIEKTQTSETPVPVNSEAPVQEEQQPAE